MKQIDNQPTMYRCKEIKFRGRDLGGTCVAPGKEEMGQTRGGYENMRVCQGKTAGIKAHLRDGMETQCSGNTLKYMRLPVMRLPVMWLCYIQFSCLLRRFHGKLKTTQVGAKKIVWASLPRTSPIQPIEHEKVKLAPSGIFTRMFQCLWCGKVFCKLLKEKHNINPATKPLICNA